MSYSTDFDFASKNLNKLFFFGGVFYRLFGVTLEKNTPFFLLSIKKREEHKEKKK